jgi:hypothetical protein
MSRPSAKIILSHTDRRWTVNEVLESPTLYAVLYNGSAVALRRSSAVNDAQARYLRTVFPTRAVAEATAKRWNALFRTTGFTVSELSPTPAPSPEGFA